MDAVVAHSQASIEQGSKSFRAAARLFSAEMREDVWLLYAWCRRCDDEIDGQSFGHDTVALTPAEQAWRLERLRDLTRRALAGEPMSDPDFAAFQRVALRHQLDPRWPQELLSGFAWDVEGRACETIEDTLTYCWGVAGTVGVMMAEIMGAHDLPVLRRAQDLGLAFQLTNMVRDIREDALNGRVYLPAEWLADEGLAASAEAVADPSNDERLYLVALRMLDLAEPYYRSARWGLKDLGLRSALAVAAARGIYREIGRRVRRKGPDALAERMSVPKPVMIWLLLRGAAIALWSRVERVLPAPERPPLWSRI